MIPEHFYIRIYKSSQVFVSYETFQHFGAYKRFNIERSGTTRNQNRYIYFVRMVRIRYSKVPEHFNIRNIQLLLDTGTCFFFILVILIRIKNLFIFIL